VAGRNFKSSQRRVKRANLRSIAAKAIGRGKMFRFETFRETVSVRRPERLIGGMS